MILQLSKDVIGIFAAEVAETGLDPHHLPGEPCAIRTLELHVDGLGLVGDAAALVCADATVFGPVLLLAGAARDSEVGGLILPVDVQTLLSWLKEEMKRYEDIKSGNVCNLHILSCNLFLTAREQDVP